MTVTYTALAVWGKPIWFSAKPPEAELSYNLDVSEIIPESEYISSVSVAIAPSGDGELAATVLSVTDRLITLTEESGQPTRVYTLKYLISTFGGLTYEVRVNQGVPPVLPTDQAPPAPDPFFGTPIIYTYVPDVDFTNVLNSAYLPLMFGL